MGVAITTGHGGGIRAATSRPAEDPADVVAAAADFAAMLAGRGFPSPDSGLSHSPAPGEGRSPGRRAPLSSERAAVEATREREPERRRDDGLRTAETSRGAERTTRRDREATRGTERTEAFREREVAARTSTNRSRESDSADPSPADESEPNSTATGKATVRNAGSGHAGASRAAAPVDGTRNTSETPAVGGSNGPRNAAAVEVATPVGPKAVAEGVAGRSASDAEGVDALDATSGGDGDAVSSPEVVDETVEISEDARSARHAPRVSADTRSVPSAVTAAVSTSDVVSPERAASPLSSTTTTAMTDVVRVAPTAVSAATATADVDADANGSGAQGQGGTANGGGSAGAAGPAAAPGSSTSFAGPRLVQTASVLPGQGSSAPSWVERVSERMRLTTTSDRIELRLELEPRGLGQIDVRLRLDADGLRAMIVAENEQTRALLANQQHLLEAALADEDVRLSSFDLDAGGNETSEGDARPDGQGRPAGASAETSRQDSEPSTTTTVAADNLGPGRLSLRV